MATDYTTLSLTDVQAALSALAQDAQATFGRLDARQLNWRPDAKRWSVAQCFDHLLSANRQMFAAADRALDGAHPPTVWQRLPGLPRLLGRMLVRSQTPGATRKFTAPRQAQPSTSAIDADVVARFVTQQGEAVARVQALAGRDLGAIVMVSPFIKVIAYSVLDGWRLVAVHGQRHVEQARRVTEAPGFPT